MSLPDGVERRTIAGEERLATRGEPVYGEPTEGEWRVWDPNRSKLGAMLDSGMETGLAGGDREGRGPSGSPKSLTSGETVLYLGAASGTTASHVADFAGPTYAIEFAPRPARDLLSAAEPRENLFPLLKDARKPETYAHVVERDVDAIVQDVATRGQADVAIRNERFLAEDGRLLAAIKARSEDVTREPDAVFSDVLDRLETSYEVLETRRLEPYHADHLAVVARPR